MDPTEIGKRRLHPSVEWTPAMEAVRIQAPGMVTLAVQVGAVMKMLLGATVRYLIGAEAPVDPQWRMGRNAFGQ